MKSRITNCIQESIKVKQNILSDENLLKNIETIVSKSVDAFKEDKKMLLCGNGGSSSDAQHIAAELSGRFYKDRKPLFAEALHVNSSFVTAVANDYGYDNIYSRMVEAAGRNGDICIGISTSGNSTNVVNAIIKAKEIGMVTIGFTGEKTGKMDELCDIMIKIPSSDTPRIQESHILVGHIICQFIEEELF
ncbi:MAG: D-sedoheptulose 7-phosphate isomerase [Flavobacteriales bacterium]|nr:D-sedoheptulose 7-phosphate isomerase [Flavobacteriales bacterium]